MHMILTLLLSAVVPSLRDRAALQLELIALRHQLAVLERKRTTRLRLTRFDRFFWVWLYRVWPGCLDAVVIVQPETVIRWHRRDTAVAPSITSRGYIGVWLKQMLHP